MLISWISDPHNNCRLFKTIPLFFRRFENLAKRFQRRRYFRYRPTWNKNCLWWPCLLTNWDELCNLYSGSFIHAFYQLSFFFLAKRFQRRRFSTNQKQELSMAAMLVNESDKMSNLFRGLSIDASYQVSVHLAKRFQIRNQRLSRACIVHLVIKKTNWSYVKTMSCVILELRST